MTFQSPNTATISAKVNGVSDKSLNIAGVTTDATTAENAAEQINKLLNIVGISVSANGMTRTLIQEAK